MKLEIGLGKFAAMLVHRVFIEAREASFHLREVLGLSAGARHPGRRKAFENATKFHQFENFREARRGHIDARSALDADQAITLELMNREAQWRFAHAQFIRDLLFDDALAGLKASKDDILAKEAIDLIADALSLDAHYFT
jgi:hypothetical protein